MESKLPIQEKSNEEELEAKIRNRITQKENILFKIKDNLNYIYIVLMIIANCLLALVEIKDGEIGLHYPSTTIGWILWAVQILLQTLIGVMILNGFRRQGIKIGHKTINKTYNEYMDATKRNSKNKNPRSLREYLVKHATFDSIMKSLIYVILSIFFGSIIIGANWNALLSLIINIIFAVGFGIKSLLDSEEFVVKELVLWYQKEIDKIKNIEKEKDTHDSKRTRIIGSTRHTKSSGIQQTQELGTRQAPCDNE